MRVLIGLLIILISISSSILACNDISIDLIENGIILYHQSNYDLATVKFDSAINADPTCIQAYIGLGNVYLLQAQELENKKEFKDFGYLLSQAKRYYVSALKIEPDNITAINQLGLVYYIHDDFITAKKQFKKVLAIDSTDATALMNMGNVLFWNDYDYPGAVLYWRKALNSNQLDKIKKAVVWKNIGIAYYKSGQKADSAVHAFKESVNIDPNSPDTYVYWGNALEFFDKYDEVIEKFETAVEIDKTYEPAYDAWAQFLYINGNDASYTYKDKILYLINKIKHVMEIKTEDARYNVHLALLYLTLGYDDKAKNELNKAIQKNPKIKIPEFGFKID